MSKDRRAVNMGGPHRAGAAGRGETSETEYGQPAGRGVRSGACFDEDDGKPFLRLEPEKRICPIQDPDSIYKYPLATREEMGFRVLDNFPEEHIQ